VSDDEKSENFWLFRYCLVQSGSPMRVSDSSVGGAAGQFHTMCWALVMISVDGSSQSVSLALCGSLVGAEGGLRP
jgi:hypothetical protein